MDATTRPSLSLPPKRWRLGPRGRRRVLAYASLYLVFLVMCFGCSLTDRFVMIPSTHPIRVPDARSELIPLGDGQLELCRGRAVTRDVAWDDIDPEAFVLEFTGNATRAEEIAGYATQKWLPHRVEVWAMNYPGYGKSTGPARLKASADAALVAYDAVKRQANGKPVFVVGNSLGTAVALHVAARRDVAGLVLTNPPPLAQLIRGKFGWWNLWLIAAPVSWGIPNELDSIRNARRVTAPAVFVTSDLDEIVPLSYQQRVVNAYAGPKRVLTRQGKGHNEPVEGDDEQWQSQQVEWLWSLANQTTRPSTREK